ncbi:MAG: hypothetical protein K9K75_01825 [Deltaproteobacteria bacterium]|nr:hypothetical protein [Deltaproteobacteria bacterium]
MDAQAGEASSVDKLFTTVPTGFLSVFSHPLLRAQAPRATVKQKTTEEYT